MRSGRPPKEQHVHRVQPTHATVVLPAEGRQGPVPKPEVTLKAGAKRVWERIWKTPQATQWTEQDLAPLTRLVVLQTDRDAWYKSSLLAEMRQLEDRYGMNPYARRQLRWQVEDEDESVPVADEPDEYGHLRAVDAG